MQKIIKNILIPAMMLLFILPQDMSAQTLRERIEARIKRRAEERLARKAEKEVDKVLDGVEESIEKKNKEERSRRPTEDGTYSGSDNVEVEIEEDNSPDAPVEPSSFIGSFTMETHEFKNGKETKNSPTSIHYEIDAYQFAIQIENAKQKDDEVRMIYDRKDRSVTMINEEENSAIITKIPKLKITVDYEEQLGEDYSFEETGKTKTIEGFLCHEYTFDSEEQSGNMWVAKDAKMDYQELGRLFGMVQVKGKGNDVNPAFEGFKGAVMESHILEKKNNQRIDMYMKNWKEGSVDAAAFDISGYEVQDMRNFMNMFKN
ncbi:MAG: DUF4412 domain-containing protein [Bacteroidota bacterium]